MYSYCGHCCHREVNHTLSLFISTTAQCEVFKCIRFVVIPNVYIKLLAVISNISLFLYLTFVCKGPDGRPSVIFEIF